MQIEDPEAGAKVPVGVLIDHGDHNALVTWATVGGFEGRFTIDSLVPLTVNEPVGCAMCEQQGNISAGQWVPSSTSKGASA